MNQIEMQPTKDQITSMRANIWVSMVGRNNVPASQVTQREMDGLIFVKAALAAGKLGKNDTAPDTFEPVYIPKNIEGNVSQIVEHPVFSPNSTKDPSLTGFTAEEKTHLHTLRKKVEDYEFVEDLYPDREISPSIA